MRSVTLAGSRVAMPFISAPLGVPSFNTPNRIMPPPEFAIARTSFMTSRNSPLSLGLNADLNSTFAVSELRLRTRSIGDTGLREAREAIIGAPASTHSQQNLRQGARIV